MNWTQEMTLQQKIMNKGTQIFSNMNHSGPSVFSKDWWYGRILDWSMKNDQFKTQMFRFVDVLPYLDSNQEVARHLKEYFSEDGRELPPVFNLGLGIGSLAPSLLAGAVRKNIVEMAKLFIVGATPVDSIKVLKRNRQQKIGFTADLLGEATLSEKEAYEYQKRYLDLMDHLSHESSQWKSIDQIDSNHLGLVPVSNVSVKLTSLYSQMNLKAWESTQSTLKERLRPIFDLAMKKKVFINLDMEQYAYKTLTLEIFSELIQEPAYQSYPFWGVVIQAYLRDSLDDVMKLVELAKRRKTPFTVRLVKGAYWDYEIVNAQQSGWPCPVFTVKQQTDVNYEKCAEYLLRHHSLVHLALGSHNVRSLAACLTIAEQLQVPQSAVEVQMLFGMADSFKQSLIRMGYRLREYSPIGELIPGMAYLVRRLLENTSNQSFLRSKFVENIPVEKLLADPNEAMVPLPCQGDSVAYFINEPLLDFSLKAHRDKMKQALTEVHSLFNKHYPLIIDGKEVSTSKTLRSLNPSNPAECVGVVSIANQFEADKAFQVAETKLHLWSETPWETRVDLLNKLAASIKEKRYVLAAWQIYECGKTWTEADADVCEAIDFCHYYAMEALKLRIENRSGSVMGEQNILSYYPRGVTVVIAPWNFPLAILTGMMAAAVVTGNTVLLKPAEQSSVVAAQLMKMISEVGFPSGVIQFLPGIGEEVGRYIVEHIKTQTIAFTGSKSVGLEILKHSMEPAPGQRHLKKCIIEMGGKNAIIVDSDADLDEAIGGIVYSAFGFQGQKCSACSRVIVLKSIYDRFLERLIEAVKSIKIGTADDPETYIGPVIDQDSKNRIEAIISEGKIRATLFFQKPLPLSKLPQAGYFIAPAIFTDISPDSDLLRKEIFGPVLSVIKAKDMDEALTLANSTEYALTGGLFSRSPATIDRVRREFHVGNLYINRGITGAMVHRHPFGGLRLSGVGAKTGGPDYLKQFVEARAVSENTLRRGFTPEQN